MQTNINREIEKNSNLSIDPGVAKIFDSYPKEMQGRLMHLRQLILDTADEVNGTGNIEETLKWGAPSYLTSQTKSGSTVRIAWKKANSEYYSIFFKCTANLVPLFKEKYQNTFNYNGNRSINFSLSNTVPAHELKQCIAIALTYHRNKKLETAERWKLVEGIK